MSGKHEITPKVNFPDIVEDETPTHKRHLTARYDKKTRRLMKEKLNLEDFIFAELRKVYMRDVRRDFCYLIKCRMMIGTVKWM